MECWGRTDGGGEGKELPPTTRATEERGAIGDDEVMTHGPGKAAASSPQQGTAADEDIAGPQKRNSDRTDGARPKNGMQLRREYGLLAPDEPTGLVMRADGDQAKTACGNIQLCAGLKAGIEGAKHTVGHQ